MTDSAPAIFVALEASGLGAAIRRSRWIYMVANIGHIVALILFAGAIAVIDVRLAGGLAATAPGPTIRRTRSVAIAAFVLLAATGMTLFSAEASHVVLNRAFQIKVALIAFGLANVAWVEWVIMPKIAARPPHAPLPQAARLAGITSILLWTGVTICGRAIAYF